MSNFNCGNCRHKIDTYGGKDNIFVTNSICGEDKSRELKVDWSDYCSKHLHKNLYDKTTHAIYTRTNNTLLGY